VERKKQKRGTGGSKRHLDWGGFSLKKADRTAAPRGKREREKEGERAKSTVYCNYIPASGGWEE